MITINEFKDLVRSAIDDELNAVREYATLARVVESVKSRPHGGSFGC